MTFSLQRVLGLVCTVLALAVGGAKAEDRVAPAVIDECVSVTTLISFSDNFEFRCVTKSGIEKRVYGGDLDPWRNSSLRLDKAYFMLRFKALADLNLIVPVQTFILLKQAQPNSKVFLSIQTEEFTKQITGQPKPLSGHLLRFAYLGGL